MISLELLWQRTPVSQARAPNAVKIFYSPERDSEKIDVSLIDRAERNIDMAAYILTDWPVMTARARAADRGVSVRLVLDASELQKDQSRAFTMLKDREGVEMRVKRDNELMHVKAFAVDGRSPRTGECEFHTVGPTSAGQHPLDHRQLRGCVDVHTQVRVYVQYRRNARGAAAHRQPGGWAPR